MCKELLRTLECHCAIYNLLVKFVIFIRISYLYDESHITGMAKSSIQYKIVAS